MLVILIQVLGFSCNSQTKPENEMSLNGEWDIIFDDTNQGISEDWYKNDVYEKQNFRKINVPSCWEEYNKNYEGVGFYRKKFNVPKSWEGKIIELNFDAVNYKSEFWLNDQVVGFHEGGYTPFSFRVDNLAKMGEENTLVIRVISPIILTDKYIDGLGRQEVPMWRGAITGGVWQPVSIKVKGTIGLKDVFIEPKIDTNTAVFNIEIENTEITTEQVEVTVNILSKNREVIASKKGNIESFPGMNALNWNISIPNATYWSPNNPFLYKAEVTIKKDGEVSDQWSHKFGMREFSVVNDQFHLNGKSIYLKAAFFEGLYPTKLGYPDSREMAIKEIKLAKEAGFNMIRPWRKPAPKMWLDLCDEMGVLTVGSLVVECMHRPISTPRLPFVVENELRKTILRNRNRTCIVQWELFNEINRPILAQMLNSMSVLARELDPTRMILDESGGWGEGANIFLPFERTSKKFNDIHHYSGSQVDEKEFDGYLATAQTNKKKEALGLKGVKSYGKNVVPGMMSYISELGYGSTPDLISNIKEFETKGNPIVAPSIYHKELNDGYITALKKVGFDEIYPNVQDFYLEQQKMHGIANKRMIEATRLNDVVEGYCVHALVGGDWVIGAGLLDLWRNPKTLVYDMTMEANQEQITPIRILPRNVYAEKGAQLEVYGVSELANEEVTVSVKIISENGNEVYNKVFDKVFKNGISTFLMDQLNTNNWKGAHTVQVEVKNVSGKVISNNNQSFDVFSKEQLTIPKAKIAVMDFDNKLTSFLDEKGIEFIPFRPDLDKNISVLVGMTGKKDAKYRASVESLRRYAQEGGYVVFFEVLGEQMGGPEDPIILKDTATEVLPLGAQMFGKWPTRGGWAAKSHVVTNHPVFKGLPTEMIMHGVYENVHPDVALAKQEGNYIAGLIGYDHFPNKDRMRRHFIGPGEVWWAADVMETPFGNGKMLLSTLRIIEFLDKDPVAEKLLYNIINYISK
ncbi:glycoside hydrolase family 2 protein [Seonamhaeicola maritimus]|uniref:glycoside hydrolase family 2 protein n=1 Tax=Seonamhaeicola maritimus TaxID=2591822 RepID=UPI002494AE66|nr:sugar-binding domain-containing protein [Seonamhaeicola maritimus]